MSRNNTSKRRTQQVPKTEVQEEVVEPVVEEIVEEEAQVEEVEVVETPQEEVTEEEPMVEDTVDPEPVVEEVLEPTPIEPFAAQAVEPEPVVEEVEVANTPSNFYPAGLEGSLYKHYDKLSANAQTGISFIFNYVNELKPGVAVSEEKGGQYQATFYRALVSALNEPSESFGDSIRILLNLFKTHKDGALNARYALRFMQEVRLSKIERDVMATLVWALQMLSEGKEGVKLFKTVEPNLVKSLLEAAPVTSIKPTMIENFKRFFS